MGRYFKKHGQKLEGIFRTEELEFIPNFPLKIPYFMELKDNEVEITNVTDYKRWKADYFHMKTIVLKLEDSIPKKWPQILPNLSTHTGEPQLIIQDKDDFTWVMVSYHTFVLKMESLKNEWTVTLRSLNYALTQTDFVNIEEELVCVDS